MGYIKDHKELIVLIAITVFSIWAHLDENKRNHIYQKQNGYPQGQMYDDEGNRIKEYRNGKLVPYKHPLVRTITWDWD